jgi:hypothetical protein
MSDKRPASASADYFQVATEAGAFCGHPHRSIESAIRCLQDTAEATAIVAIWKRKDAIGTAKLYNKDAVYLSLRQVQSLMKWQKRNRESEE